MLRAKNLESEASSRQKVVADEALERPTEPKKRFYGGLCPTSGKSQIKNLILGFLGRRIFHSSGFSMVKKHKKFLMSQTFLHNFSCLSSFFAELSRLSKSPRTNVRFE